MGLSAQWFCPGPPVDQGGGQYWCLYNIYKLATTTPSIIASAIVGTWVWRKRRRMNKEDPRRTRTLADFFDKLVGRVGRWVGGRLTTYSTATVDVGGRREVI